MLTEKQINWNIDKFMYWMQERQRIYNRKEAGKPRPWTEDSILNEYKFTNVFRQQDRVTVELNKRYRARDSKEKLLWKILVFRMFNWPDTYDSLDAIGMIENWNEAKAKKALHNRKSYGHQVFTGAYIITNSGSTRPKIDLACEALTAIWNDLEFILDRIVMGKTLHHAWAVLMEYPMMGKFTAYEVVTDLRHTKILNKAPDIYTWANPGPGARRGCNRIFRGDKAISPKRVPREKQFITEMRYLQDEIIVIDKKRLEMRDIEHSLCEFDKYERVRLGEGRPRSKYHGQD